MGQAAGVPHLQARKGPLGVLQYFQIVARWEVREFRVLSLMEGGNQVAAEVLFEATLPGRRQLRDEEIHLWTFDVDGKVARFRQYVDTAKHMVSTGLLVRNARRQPPPAASAEATG